MTREEAEEILAVVDKFEDVSCFCHINPPCSKCEQMPDDEQIKEAEEVLNDIIYEEIKCDIEKSQ